MKKVEDLVPEISVVGVQNVVNLSGILARIAALRMVKFNFVGTDPADYTGFGVTEYNVQFPNTAIDPGTDEIYSTNEVFIENLIPYGLQAIKELNTKVDAIISLGQTISAEGDLGTITWTGTSPGSVTKKYRWSKTGRVVTLDWYIKGTAGLLVTGMSVPLPSDAPAPVGLSNISNDSWAVIGNGALIASANTNPPAGSAGLFKTSAGAYTLRNSVGLGLSATVAQGQVQYLTA